MRLSRSFIKVFSVCVVISGILSLHVYYHWEKIWTAWAKYYISDQDIIITFTTTPQRIRLLEDPLQCLMRQNAPIRGVFLSVPHKFKRDNSEYIIPDWLDCHPNVTIIRTDDYGPATKILGALKHAPITDDTIVIAVDDDTCYPDNLVLRLAVRAKRYPQQVIGASGAELDFDQNKEGGIVKVFKDKKNVTIVEGFAGIAYRRKFFDESIYEIKEEPSFCYLSDDLYISHHLARHNVIRQSINNKFIDVRKNVKQLQYGYHPDALYQQGNSQAERYKLCYSYLKQRFPEVVFNGNGIK